MNDVRSIGIEPVYGLNYYKGYVGFCSRAESLFARGITYVTRWEKMSDIATHHCFVVADMYTCIEATADGSVAVNLLSKYFEPNKGVFFRKPVGLSDDIADRIVKTAKNEIGKPYDFKAILVQGLSGTFAGRLLTDARIESIAKVMDSPNKWICSELCATALEVGFDRNLFPMSHNSLSPQELFESSVFEEWK